MNPSMKSLTPPAGILLAIMLQGCATAPQPTTMGSGHVEAAVLTNPVSSVGLCAAKNCADEPQKVVPGAEIGIEKNAPVLEGHPLTAVVVTQCNLVVAVYMTMPDGRLLRFDKSAKVPAEQLVSIAYTATRSERIEVSCEGNGIVGYEKHEGAV
jgi:hypothetical protein